MNAVRVVRLLSLAVLLASLFGPMGLQPAAAGGGTFTVNSPGNEDDVNTGDGVCLTSNSNCTLRAAITQANANIGLNTIDFNLPGAGTQIIFVSSTALPNITDQVMIDATTQPGCTAPCVVLNGTPLGSVITAIGLNLQTSNSTVKGFVITSFARAGIFVQGNYNTIQGNVVGFWPGVGTALGNWTGIWVVGSNNLIGGTLLGQRNWVSGNAFMGIEVETGDANVIQGNYIGTNTAGTAALGNGDSGILVLGTNTLIGGTTAGARNVISGNNGSGVEAGGSGTVIQGNFIGTKASGSGALGNGTYGIYVSGSSVTIGGTTNAAGNRIANNGAMGVVVSSMFASARIRHNRIYHNASLGIDLAPVGVTPNDLLDVDTGANGLQNFPAITSATSGTLTIVGKLNSKASTAYVIEFFASPAGTCDTLGYGEGAKFLGQKSVMTDVTGLAKFKFVSAVPFAAGNVITATATDPDGKTSEFSACRTAG